MSKYFEACRQAYITWTLKSYQFYLDSINFLSFLISVKFWSKSEYKQAETQNVESLIMFENFGWDFGQIGSISS